MMPNRECKTGWIGSYIDYTRPQQAPTLFHSWVAVSTIASALRRRVWIDRGYYTLYPNLFLILVSASGVGTKTTAIRVGTEDILAKSVPDLTIMRGALTTKFLIQWMSQSINKNPFGNAEVTIMCEEFKVFAKGIYTDSGLIENLTKLYDNGIWEYSTGGQGVIKVEKPCINLIAGSTPEWLTTSSASDFIGGGFSSRIVPVSVTQDEKIVSWPEKTQLELDIEKRLIHDLNQISALGGSFLVTTDAKKYFDKWYKDRNKYRKEDKRMDGYYSKKHDLVLKIAMVFSVSISDDLVINEDHIEASIKSLGKMEENIPFAFQGVVWGEEAKYQERVLMKIQQTKEITHPELLRSFSYCLSGTDLDKIIKTLLDPEQICWEKHPGKGRPTVKYKPR